MRQIRFRTAVFLSVWALLCIAAFSQNRGTVSVWPGLHTGGIVVSSGSIKVYFEEMEDITGSISQVNEWDHVGVSYRNETYFGRPHRQFTIAMYWILALYTG